MNLKKILALVLCLAIAAVSFAGCAGGGTAATGETSTGEGTATSTDAYPGTPEEGAITLNIATEPPDLNTLTGTYSMAFSVMRHLYQGLITLDENDNPTAGMAETWEVSDDGLNYTFHLREGSKWTNGEPVTANDFIFAWSKLIDPATASEYAYFGYNLFKNGLKFYNGECGIEDVGFKAVDDYTIEVTLENPTPYALFLFSFGSLLPVNEKFYNEVGADNYNLDTDKFCTNGPFTMTEWTHNSNIVITKNDDYYDADKVSVKKITFVMLNDSATGLSSFKAGEVDMIGLSGDQATELKNEGYPVQSYSDGSAFYVLFNCSDEYMSNVNLRKAINLSYSRTAYIGAILKDSSLPGVSFTCPGVAGFDGTPFADAVAAKYGQLYPTEADPDAAKEYLDKALSELGITLEELNSHISMNCGDSDVAKQQAEFFQEQLRTSIGVELTINSMTTKAQSEERTNMNYVMDFSGWGPDYNDAMTFLDMWMTESPNNTTGWGNAEYDGLIEQAMAETDLAKRQDYLIECEKILADELPISNTYWRIRNYVTSGKITGGYLRSTFQDINFVYATLK